MAYIKRRLDSRCNPFREMIMNKENVEITNAQISKLTLYTIGYFPEIIKSNNHILTYEGVIFKIFRED